MVHCLPHLRTRSSGQVKLGFSSHGCDNRRMEDGSETVPVEIAAEAGVLIDELRLAGWTVHESQFDAKFFGNWFVDLRCENRALRLLKDRSQFMVGGPPTQEIKDAGLWRAFESFEQFCNAVRKYVRIREG